MAGGQRPPDLARGSFGGCSPPAIGFPKIELTAWREVILS
jgi:hypothetical protein